MKIVFTGGGTGGHFTPIIAVAERVNQIIDHEKIVGAKLYYFSDDPYDKEALFEASMSFEEVNSGKMQTGFSISNIFGFFKTVIGTIRATIKIFAIYPDVVFSKGGYAALPTLLAARLLNIPVVIHESDSVPDNVNKWAGKFAKKIAISFAEAAEYFPKEKAVWTGQPVRMEIEQPAPKDDALKYFKIESELPVLLVLGGSLGAELVNNTIIDALPDLLNDFQIIHQTGVQNYKMVIGRSGLVLENNPAKARYMPIAYLNALQMKMAAGLATIVVSRAGSTLFEIASWGLPSILVPVTESHMNHQRKNAYAYARAGGCSVIEEANMTPHVLISEIKRIVEHQDDYLIMQNHAKAFSHRDAAMKIAREIVDIALSHEK